MYICMYMYVYVSIMYVYVSIMYVYVSIMYVYVSVCIATGWLVYFDLFRSMIRSTMHSAKLLGGGQMARLGGSMYTVYYSFM